MQTGHRKPFPEVQERAYNLFMAQGYARIGDLSGMRHHCQGAGQEPSKELLLECARAALEQDDPSSALAAYHLAGEVLPHDLLEPIVDRHIRRGGHWQAVLGLYEGMYGDNIPIDKLTARGKELLEQGELYWAREAYTRAGQQVSAQMVADAAHLLLKAGINDFEKRKKAKTYYKEASKLAAAEAAQEVPV